jgi:predicted SAM-dependent methyltransferase
MERYKLSGFKQSLARLLPRRIWKILRWELQLQWRLLLQKFSPRYRARLKHWQAKRDIRINLGALDSGKEEWLNVDATPSPALDFLCDLRRPLPLGEGVAECLFCEHVMEHFDYEEEIPSFLQECKRLLKPGGVVRLVVPDGEKYCRMLASESWEQAKILRDPSRYRTRMEMVNDAFRQDSQHLFAYDGETMELVLKEAGFDEIRVMKFGESRVQGLAIEQAWRAEESLHVEAVKK